MKTKLFLVLSIAGFISSHLSAQISIDSTDMPSIGDTIILASDTTAPAGLMIGGAGSQTWDFSSIQVDNLDTMLFVDPASTTFAADFPNSNLTVEGIQPNIFQTLSSSALIIDGNAGDDPFGAGATISASFIPAQKLLDLPSTDGSIFSDTTGFDQTIETASLGLPVPNVDSIRLVHYAWPTSIIDAYGDVTTPAGTFTTIRQLYTEPAVDSIFAYCSDLAGCNVFIAVLPFGWSFVPSALTEALVGISNPGIDTSYTYKWWAKGEDVPVAEVETDGPGGTALSAKYKLGNSVIAMAGGTTEALCKDSCDGTATVNGLGGSGSYTYVWDDPAAQTTATATGLCAGTHNAYIVDGIDTSGTVTVTVGEPTGLLIILTNTPSPSDTAGIATALVSGGTGPYFYLWNTTPVQLTASAINLAPGTYSVTVTDDNGCEMSDSTTIPVGIEDIGANTFISIYPNPAMDELFINADIEKNASFLVYNILGEQVLNVNIENKLNIINTEDLANGMYVYQIVSSKGTIQANGKFSIER